MSTATVAAPSRTDVVVLEGFRDSERLFQVPVDPARPVMHDVLRAGVSRSDTLVARRQSSSGVVTVTRYERGGMVRSAVLRADGSVAIRGQHLRSAEDELLLRRMFAFAPFDA